MFMINHYQFKLNAPLLSFLNEMLLMEMCIALLTFQNQILANLLIYHLQFNCTVATNQTCFNIFYGYLCVTKIHMVGNFDQHNLN
jgi:hypothetical protein